jgi:hypothetical protein
LGAGASPVVENVRVIDVGGGYASVGVGMRLLVTTKVDRWNVSVEFVNSAGVVDAQVTKSVSEIEFTDKRGELVVSVGSDETGWLRANEAYSVRVMTKPNPPSSWSVPGWGRNYKNAVRTLAPLSLGVEAHVHGGVMSMRGFESDVGHNAIFGSGRGDCRFHVESIGSTNGEPFEETVSTTCPLG